MQETNTGPHLTILDGSRFPLVRLDVGKIASGGIDAMIEDFETLLADEQPFALSMHGRGHDSKQAHDDQKRWVLWLKENKIRMAAVCRGIVSVRDTASNPAIQEKQTVGLQAMIGVPVRLTDDVEQADRIAADLLN